MKSAQIEFDLTRGGWEWAYVEEVTLRSIDMGASKVGQTRMTTKKDKIQDWVRRLSAGGKMNAVTLTPAPGYEFGGATCRFRTANGNHRLAAAAEAGWTSVDAYVVLNADTPERAEKLRLMANTDIVAPREADEALMNAVRMFDLCAANGMTQVEAARACNVEVSRLNRLVRVRDVTERLVRLEPGLVAAMSGEALLRLGKIGRDDLFVGATRIVHSKSGKDGDVCRELTDEAVDVVVDADAAAVVTRWAARYPPRPAVEPRPSPADKEVEVALARLARLKSAVNSAKKISIGGLDVETRRRLRDGFKAAGEALADLAGAADTGIDGDAQDDAQAVGDRSGHGEWGPRAH